MREEQRRRARILVVDDEPQNVRYVVDVLEWAGYERVEGLTDSLEALARFDEMRPDLVILDLLMPGMGGFEILESMRERLEGDEYLPFLVLTSDISSESRRKALSSGAKDFLTKPMSPTEVRLRVDNLLETRFLYLELARRGRDRAVADVERGSIGEGSDRDAELIERWAASLDHLSSRGEGRGKRVAWLAGRIGQQLDMPEEDLDRLRQAAQLHALGARAAPEGAAGDRGTGLLHDPVAGARLLEGAEHPVLVTTRRMLSGLEEWWDGSGGPSRLRGEAIPLEARIVAAAMFWDGLELEGLDVAARVAAVRDLAGSRFDPRVAGALVQAQTVEA